MAISDQDNSKNAKPEDKKPVDKAETGIAINFTPQIKTAVSQTKPTVDQTVPVTEKKEVVTTEKPVVEKAPQLVQLDVKKEELSSPKPPTLLNLSATENKADVKVSPEVKSTASNLSKEPDFFDSKALKEKNVGSKIVENIAAQKALQEKPDMEELLGKKSAILEQSIEKETMLRMKKKVRLTQIITIVVAVGALLINGFFYYQLNPGLNLLGFVNYNFEGNLRSDLYNLNQTLKSVKTDSNKYNYLTAQLYLNQFGYESTRFFDGISQLESARLLADRATTESQVEEAKLALPTLLANIKTNLASPITVETYATRGEDEDLDAALATTYFQRELKVAINKEKSDLKTAAGSEKERSSLLELSMFDNAVKLVNNTKLLNALNSTTVEAYKSQLNTYQTNTDAALRSEFRSFVENLLASTKINLATVSGIKNQRIRWSDVMDRLDLITNRVNAEHNKGVRSSNASQIKYSSINLDSQSGKVSVNALNTTQSGTNREVVTYLIDSLEASPEFKNVSNRNFPLSKTTDSSGNEIYSMSFKIDMEIESGAFTDLNQSLAALNLSSQKVARVKVPVNKK